MIRLTENELQAIKQHSVEEYPHECCGVVLGLPGDPGKTRIQRCTNIQNKLHGQDPEKFPRDARTAYYIDPQELLKTFRDAEKEGLEVIGFYHSHPDHEAYFSQEDFRMAMLGDEPSYPNASYIVVSVFNRSVRDLAVFSWRPESRSFEKNVLP